MSGGKSTEKNLLHRDKATLDIFWLKDESLKDSANLPPPNIIAAEFMEDRRRLGAVRGERW